MSDRIKIEVVRKVGTPEGWDFEDNPTLRRIIEWALNESLENFTHKVLKATCKASKIDVTEADNIWVRVGYSTEPKCGFCYRQKGTRVAEMPDIFAGWANDVRDFAETIAHEGLHALGWGEKMIEEKAVKIAASVLKSGVDNG